MKGRPRVKFQSLPKHIEANKIPSGLYWRATAHGGVWYRLVDGKRENVATETATQGDLFAIMEYAENLAGSVDRVCTEFHKSLEFRDLAKGTKRNYNLIFKFISKYPTKLGIPFGMLQVDRISTPIVQRLIETIGRETPSKANHLQRYLGRTFAWGKRSGYCKTNPAKGVRQVKEAKKNTMPELAIASRLLSFVLERGKLAPHTKGSVAPYLFGVIELAYACRLRGIEVISLTDADKRTDGIYCRRTKGSLDNVTKWNERMRIAWDSLDAIRAIARESKPVPMRPEARWLVVGQSGEPLAKSSFDSAWQRMIRLAIQDGVISASERFSLHGMKHRGITDTKGNSAVKQEASGHKSKDAFDRYNHDIPVVEPAEIARETSK
jgi:integrase